MYKAAFLSILSCGYAYYHFLEATLATCTTDSARTKFLNRVKQKCPRNNRYDFVWKILRLSWLT